MRGAGPGPDAGRDSDGGAARLRPGCGGPFLWFFLVLVAWVLVRPLLAPPGPPPLDYSAFRTQVRDGNVVEITVRGDRIHGVLAAPVTRVQEGDTVGITEFVTHTPAFGDPELLGFLESHGVAVATEPEAEGSWTDLLLLGLLPLGILFLMLFVWGRSMGGGGRLPLSLGRSGARKYEPEGPATTFDDVAGAAGAKQELGEIVEFLRDPSRFHRLAAEVPRGVLLVGPPGTGKTLLARAVAGEADVAFFTITGSDFMEMFVGVGAKRVRTLFDTAKKAAPAIVFIDELDSIGRRRGTGLGGGHDEREQTLNQLLSALDGFEPAENVVVLAATNRPDTLDPALLRPGRFDRRIAVDLPSSGERLEILRLHAREMPLEADVELEPMARGTPGFSGADLKNLLNEAALNAARRDAERIATEDFESARDRILMGLKREGLALTDEEIRLLAYHEAGHAVVAATLPAADPVHKVTIIPRGRAMGGVHQLPERERYLWRREDLEARIALSLGGRAAEEMVFATRTSGAEDDLDKATKLARRMVLRWGMSDELGPYAAEGGPRQTFLGEQLATPSELSEATSRMVDEETRRILREGAERARKALEEHREALDHIAERLVEREEITGDEVMELVADARDAGGTA